jgi:hypothetical protein
MNLLCEALSHRSEVVFVTNERECDKVHPLLEPDLEIGAVLLRKGCDPEVGLREIDSLARGDRSANDHATEKTVFLDLDHFELGETVGEKNALADTDVFEEMWIVDRENAVCGLPGNTERDGGPRLEMDSFFGEFPEADLGAPEILEDADLATE